MASFRNQRYNRTLRIQDMSDKNTTLSSISKFNSNITPIPPKKEFNHLDIHITNLIKTIYKHIGNIGTLPYVGQELLIIAETTIRLINIKTPQIRPGFINLLKTICNDYQKKCESNDPISISCQYILDTIYQDTHNQHNQHNQQEKHLYKLPSL